MPPAPPPTMDDFLTPLQSSIILLSTGTGEERVQALENIVYCLKLVNREAIERYRCYKDENAGNFANDSAKQQHSPASSTVSSTPSHHHESVKTPPSADEISPNTTPHALNASHHDFNFETCSNYLNLREDFEKDWHTEREIRLRRYLDEHAEELEQLKHEHEDPAAYDKTRHLLLQQIQSEATRDYWNRTNDIFIHLIRSARTLLVHRSSYIRASAARVFKYLILLGLDRECWKFGVDALLFRMFDIPSGKEKEQVLYIAYALCEPHISYFPTPIMKGLMNVCINSKDKFRTMALEILCQLLMMHPKVGFIFPTSIKILVYTATLWSVTMEQSSQLGRGESPAGTGAPNDLDSAHIHAGEPVMERSRSPSGPAQPTLNLHMRENACQTLVYILDQCYMQVVKDGSVSTEKIHSVTSSLNYLIFPFLDHLSWGYKTEQELVRSWKQSYESLIYLSMHWSGVYYMGANLFGPMFQSLLLPPPEPAQINSKIKRAQSSEELAKKRVQYEQLNIQRVHIILDTIIGILRVACPKYLIASLIPDTVSHSQLDSGNHNNMDSLHSTTHDILGDSTTRGSFNPTPQRKDIINQYIAVVLRAMIRNYILEVLFELGKSVKRANAVLQVVLSLIDVFLGSQTAVGLIQGFDSEYSKILACAMYVCEDTAQCGGGTTNQWRGEFRKLPAPSHSVKSDAEAVFDALTTGAALSQENTNTPTTVVRIADSPTLEPVNTDIIPDFDQLSSTQRKLFALLGEVMRHNRIDYNMNSYYQSTRNKLTNHYHLSHNKRRTYVGNIGTNTLDMASLAHLIKESQVPNKDVKKWRWDIIMELMRYRLPEQEKFLKRLLTFFRPRKKIFNTLAYKDSHMKYCEVGCQLLRYIVLVTYSGESARTDTPNSAQSPISMSTSMTFSNNTVHQSLSQLLTEIVELIDDSTEEHIATTMTRTYFEMLGVLSQFPQGIIILKEHQVFRHMRSWIEDGQRDDIAQLCLKNLSYQFKDSPARAMLVSALKTSSNKTRYYATLRLKSLIHTISDFSTWGMQLLHQQTQDQWPEVVKNALRILHEACVFDKANLDALLEMQPNIDTLIQTDERGIQQQSLQLLYFILRSSRGLSYVEEKSPLFIMEQLERWESYQAIQFTLQMEQIISRTIKSNMNKNITFIRSHMRVTGSSSVQPNLYASLVHTEEGAQILMESRHAHFYVDKVVQLHAQQMSAQRENISLHDVDVTLRTAMWMLGFIGQHDIGMRLLLSIREDILDVIISLAEEAPLSSVRGITLYVVSLFCRCQLARDFFTEKGWIVDTDSFTALPRNDSQLFDMVPPEERGLRIQQLNRHHFYHASDGRFEEEVPPVDTVKFDSDSVDREESINNDNSLSDSWRLTALKRRLALESEESIQVLDLLLRANNPVHQKDSLEKLSKMKEDNLYVFKDPRLFVCSYVALGTLSFSGTARNTLHKIFDGWNVTGLGFDWYDEVLLELIVREE